MTRVYLPATAALLARALATGAIPAQVGHAVTPALREWYTGGDLEELELAAITDAAQASLSLIAAERDGDGGHHALPRRLVIVVEAPVLPPASLPAQEGAVVVGERPTGRSAVALAGDLAWSAVVSVHVDDADAVPDVAAAVMALPGAARGEEDARYAVEDAEAHDLLWYDPSEVAGLLTELVEPPDSTSPTDPAAA